MTERSSHAMLSAPPVAAGFFIGPVLVAGRLLSAPVAGVSNLPWRLLARWAGAGLAFTEMIKARPLVGGVKKTRQLLKRSPDEKPLGVQLSCAEPGWLGEAVRILAADGFDVIDLNMGCPVRKVVGAGEGSNLMRRPDAVAKLVSVAAKAAGDVPVTVKIRAGWDRESINAPEIARIAEDNGARAVTVHGRTRCQQFSGKADWGVIARVKEAVSVPVIGNGDVRTGRDAARMLEETGCDGVMIARAALGNPWVFRDMRCFLETGRLLPPPNAAEKGRVLLWHHERLVEVFGEHIAVLMTRKHAAWYTRGLPGRAAINRAFQNVASSERVRELAQRHFGVGEGEQPRGRPDLATRTPPCGKNIFTGKPDSESE